MRYSVTQNTVSSVSTVQHCPISVQDKIDFGNMKSKALL